MIMKAYLFYPIIFLSAVSSISCNKDVPNDPIAVKDLSVSDCKSKSGNAKGIGKEYITIKTVGDFYLIINHFNSMFNCHPGEITVAIDITSNIISMDENESSSLANCICPYDINFRLGPLMYGTYILNFKKGGLTFKEYTLNFRKSTDIRIDL